MLFFSKALISFTEFFIYGRKTEKKEGWSNQYLISVKNFVQNTNFVGTAYVYTYTLAFQDKKLFLYFKNTIISI